MSHPSYPTREHLNVIDPEAGKRYKLHIKGAVHKLTIGKVKHCLATASSCPIPESQMVLKLNGVPLSDDNAVCGSLGILTGATLTIEERVVRTQQQKQQERSGWKQRPYAQTDTPHYSGSGSGGGAHRSFNGDGATPSRGEESHERSAIGVLERGSDCAKEDGGRGGSPLYEDEEKHYMGSLASPQRRLLELQTLQEQEYFVRQDSRARGGALRSSLTRLDEELERSSAARQRLVRAKSEAESELRALREREAATAKERERLAAIQEEEESRAAERAADLAARREQLRHEQDHFRRVAQLKLENEKRKALLDSQRVAYEEERRRAALALKALEEEDKRKQLSIRAKEIDMEHQRLEFLRGCRELLEERQEALMEKESMYARMGVEPPVELLRERAALEADAAALGAEMRPLPPPLQLRDGSEAKTPPPHRVGPSASTEGGARSVHGPSSATLVGRGAGSQHSGELQLPPPSSRASTSTSPGQVPLTVPALPDGCYYDALENAVENLRRLGDDLGLTEPLSFDEANTCVISVDGEYTLLVTYDAATERLYLYSTLLTAIPSGEARGLSAGAATTTTTTTATATASEAAAFRLKLYEYLLEGSLLGRDMCGGGISASLKKDFILMSTSIYMPTSQPWALRTMAPQFLQCLQHWRERVAGFIEGHCNGYAIPAASGEGGGGRGGGGGAGAAAASSRESSLLFSRDDFLKHKPLHAPPLEQPQQMAGHRESPVMGLEVADAPHLDGVLVRGVAGPAALAGLQPYDVLTAVDGVRVRSVGDFHLVVSRLRAGQVVSLQVMRGETPWALSMQIGSVWLSV